MTDPSVPLSDTLEGPQPRPEARWLLRLIFGGALTAFVAFWALMLIWGPNLDEGDVRMSCAQNVRLVREALREVCKTKGIGIAQLLALKGRGATIGPIFPLLVDAGLVPDPPPRTPSCRSWKDYTVVDPNDPKLEALSCRIHGGAPVHTLPVDGRLPRRR